MLDENRLRERDVGLSKMKSKMAIRGLCSGVRVHSCSGGSTFPNGGVWQYDSARLSAFHLAIDLLLSPNLQLPPLPHNKVPV